MKTLEGKTVRAILINHEKDLIRLICDGPALFLSATGDCCSRSWFEHMTGVEALIGHAINAVIERPMPGDKEETPDRVIRFYGWTLETSRGRCDIEMRNESNGWYGGDCIVSEKALDQYHGERDDESSAQKLVTDDF